MHISDLAPLEGEKLIKTFAVHGSQAVETIKLLTPPIDNLGSKLALPLVNGEQINQDFKSFMLNLPNYYFRGGAQNLFSVASGQRIRHNLLDYMHCSGEWPEKWQRIFDTEIPKKATKIEGRVLLLAGTWSLGYYHFVLETLAKLTVAMRLGETFMRSLDIIAIGTDKHIPRYVFEWLAIFGVNVHKLRLLDPSKYYQSEEIYLPSVRSPWGFSSATYLNELRRKSTQYLDSNGYPITAGPKLIYISRKTRRSVLEEDYLVDPILKRFGFKRVFLEDHSVAEQLFIIRSAEKIVALHGAGLANTILFDGKLLEIFGDKYWNACYARLALNSGFSYSYYVAKELNDGRLLIDTLEFSVALEKFVSQ